MNNNPKLLMLTCTVISKNLFLLTGNFLFPRNVQFFGDYESISHSRYMRLVWSLFFRVYRL